MKRRWSKQERHMSKGILESELFYCDHIGANPNDATDVKGFVVDRGPGLEDYIRSYALDDEELWRMRTYLVRDKETDELAAYFSVKAGLISVNEREEKSLSFFGRKREVAFDTLPGIELADFAVNSSYIASHADRKGLGLIVFSKFVLPLVMETAEKVGVYMLYIFALPSKTLIQRYKKYGFTRLDRKSEKALHIRIKPAYDKQCIFMYQRLKPTNE